MGHAWLRRDPHRAGAEHVRVACHWGSPSCHHIPWQRVPGSASVPPVWKPRGWRGSGHRMAALPAHPCYAEVSIPALPPPTDRNTGLESPAEDVPLQEPCWMMVWHRLLPGALDGDTNHSESKSKCLPCAIDHSCGLCVPRC